MLNIETPFIVRLDDPLEFENYQRVFKELIGENINFCIFYPDPNGAIPPFAAVFYLDGEEEEANRIVGKNCAEED
jgi:hypothetical protein